MAVISFCNRAGKKIRFYLTGGRLADGLLTEAIAAAHRHLNTRSHKLSVYATFSNLTLEINQDSEVKRTKYFIIFYFSISTILIGNQPRNFG